MVKTLLCYTIKKYYIPCKPREKSTIIQDPSWLIYVKIFYLCFLIKKYFSFVLKFLVYEFKSFITDAKHIYTVQLSLIT